jgi:hypothetical protein
MTKQVMHAVMAVLYVSSHVESVWNRRKYKYSQKELVPSVLFWGDQMATSNH